MPEEITSQNEPVVDDGLMSEIPGNEPEGKPGSKPEGKEPPKEDPIATAARELASAARELKKPAAEPTKPKETPEEFRRRMKAFEPDEAWFQSFFGLEADADPKQVQTRKEAFVRLHNGMIEHAVNLANELLQRKLAQFEPQLQQVSGFITQQEAKRMNDSFRAKYEVFKDPKYNKLVNLAAQELAGQDFPDEEKFFDALAERAAEAIKVYVPDFDLGAKKTTPTTTPKVPRTSAGGTGGTSRSGSDDGKGFNVLDVFD